MREGIRYKIFDLKTILLDKESERTEQRREKGINFVYRSEWVQLDSQIPKQE